MLNTPLSLKNVSITIGERAILSDVTFNIAKGEFVLLVGSNGAGKSTLIKAIMGDQPVSSGHLKVKQAGFIAQDPRDSTYDDLTVRENCRLRSGKDCTEHLRRFNPKLAEMMDRPVSRLSGGERQVLALALCLLDPPDLLLLDEHTSALDPKTADRVMDITLDMAKAFNVATLMTTHNLEHAEKYDARVLGLKRGRIVFDGKVDHRRTLLSSCYD